MRLSVLMLCPMLAVSACAAPDTCAGLAGGSLHDCRWSQVDKAMIMAAVWSEPRQGYHLEPVYTPPYEPLIAPVRTLTCNTYGNLTTCN